MTTGLGGLLLRDIVLQAGTPVILQNPVYLIIAFATAVVGLFFAGLISRMAGLIVVLDGLALGFLCTAGAIAALAQDLAPSSVIFIGVITGIGGLILRDVMAGDAPRIVLPGTFVAIPAIVASSVFVLLLELNANWTLARLAAMAIALGLRAGTHWLGWRTKPAADLSNQVWGIWGHSKPRDHVDPDPSPDTSPLEAVT